jgi:hypothetical protein
MEKKLSNLGINDDDCEIEIEEDIKSNDEIENPEYEDGDEFIESISKQL